MYASPLTNQNPRCQCYIGIFNKTYHKWKEVRNEERKIRVEEKGEGAVRPYIIQLLVSPLIKARTLVQHGVYISEATPVSSEIVGHEVNGVQQTATHRDTSYGTSVLK